MTLVNFAPKPLKRSRNTNRNTNAFFRNAPLVNIYEQDDAFEIQLAVPGIAKDQISIDITDDQLIIEATAQSEEGSTDSETNYLRKEYDFSSFKKVFNLNEEINQEAIDASLTDGVLTITLDKKEEAKAIAPRTNAIK